MVTSPTSRTASQATQVGKEPKPQSLYEGSRRTSILDPAPSDAELVRRACEGDRWAEEAIYRRYVQYVASVAARALHAPQDTRDVVQETFVAAFEQLGALREGAALRVWLARIALNQVRRRSRWRRWLGWLGTKEQEAALEIADERAGPELQVEIGLLDEALDSVPCDARVAWVLHRVQGETVEAVAEALGCSLATAKRRVGQAEQVVARHFASKEDA
jgi:RNA polymerase sigma-70 factor, ECF subfamily